jgi:enoyl-CoA hydratase/carnithine racemase
VTVITLNRPERLNALVPEMLAEYVDMLYSADADPTVRCIVVTGQGRGFCSGADISILESDSDGLQHFLDHASPEKSPIAAISLSTPVVAAVNGPTAGLGFVIAAAADLRFISAGATLSTTFARLGLVAEYGIAWLLPRIIGSAHSADLLLSGRTISAEEAAAMGFGILTEDSFTSAMQWAADVAENCAPSSLRSIKRQLLREPQQEWSSAAKNSFLLMGEAFGGPDLSEALQARADKRSPRFAGS